MPAPLVLLAAAWPVVSASLLTAGRYVAMTAIPAAARFATAPSTISAATTTLSGVGTVAKVVANNKVNTLLAGVAVDGVLGTNVTATALKGAGTALSGVAGVFADGAKNNIKELTGVQLGGASADAGGTPSQQSRDSTQTQGAGAPAATGSAGGAQGGTQQEETVVEKDENGVERRVPRSQSIESRGQQMLQGLMDKAKDNPWMALGVAIGGAMGLKNSNGMAEMAWKVPLYATMYGFIFKMLGPILGPLLGVGKDFLQSTLGISPLQSAFHTPQVAPYANGGKPAADVKPEAANDPAADAVKTQAFRDNADQVTQVKLVDDNTRVNLGGNRPAANRSLYELTVNG